MNDVIEEEHIAKGEENASLDDLAKESSPISDDKRNKRVRGWMVDYESGEGLSGEEEDVANFIMFTTIDPSYFEDAMKSEKWKKVMDLEIEAKEKNNIWELTNLLTGGKKIGVKWDCKIKLNKNVEVEKYKGLLVTNECSQQYGIDYSKVCALVA